MLIVGLTGGIGSGKSTVSEMFDGFGITVIDTDVIARSIVMPSTYALNEIIKRFGKNICDDNGELKRSELRTTIFNHPNQKLWLENLLHPLIRTEVLSQLAEITKPYCLLAIPLLLETQYSYPIQRILVVDSPTYLQLERIQQRDKISQQQAQLIIDNQVKREQRLISADDVLVNDGDLITLKRQVTTLHKKYLELAQPSTN